MRISDWSSDVCSSDLPVFRGGRMVQTIDVMGGGSQAQAAATRIKAAIHGAQFGPGQRLVESELVQLLGVGRGPVREALRLLSVEGFVRIERNKGAVVAQEIGRAHV